uniref:Uncharacterized protein n=1 Tax=Rhizophagus irregularis (strain DAOM 181602 / DAOM 197198 / MUCL 43194) TaxID=747089 RepID=U9U4Y8_RHIID
MRKALDTAIATNSYDEFIGICHGFISDKQAILESDDNNQMSNNNASGSNNNEKDK